MLNEPQPRRKATLNKIVLDVLLAAVELRAFNIKQLADRSGHHWQPVSRVVHQFLMKDSLNVGFDKADVEGFYKVINMSPSTRAVDKAKVKNLLEKYVAEGSWKERKPSKK